MASFGWSASDIAMAVRVVWQIVEAFDKVKGARAKYATSQSFLRGLLPVLQRIQQYLENPEHDLHREDMNIQGKIIGDAYASFDTYLKDRIGLSSRESHMRSFKDKLLSALDDIQKKVQKLKTEVVDAMAFLGPLLAFEIR